MARITFAGELASTFFFEFENHLYFKVEISRSFKQRTPENTEYFAETYQLRLPHGSIALPSSQRLDTTFRQSWFYLEDFPLFSGPSVDSVRTIVETALIDYAQAYLSKFVNGSKRAEPHH